MKATKTAKKRRKPYGEFALTAFKNPSGEKVYRVSGTINGRRVRRNFKTKEEAITAKQTLNLQYIAERNEEKVIVTTLTREQCDEAKVAFKLLEDRKKPLSFYMQYALDRYREAEFELTVKKAVRHFLEHKSWEEERGIITLIHYNHI